MEKLDFKVGEQIAYIPSHADGIDHEDVEFGFITKVETDVVFCRFWYPDGTLRTTANSEMVPKRYVIRHKLWSQPKINKLLIELGYKTKRIHFFSAGAERDGESTILTWMVLTDKETLRKVREYYTYEQFPKGGGWTNHEITEIQRVPDKLVRKAYQELKDEN